MNTFCIKLEACEFFAYHGLYEQEKIQGNTFWVDIEMLIPASDFEIEGKLENSVDYQKLYELTSKRMQIPTPLLETLCIFIAKDIAHIYPAYLEIKVSLTKNQPPISGICKNSKVTYTLQPN